eukprot:CAMPEP_0177765592 /NCGR_PEP_ID=MMETSP0491_2-20121128/8074_1 /TAXON_ID=63592 /ORGANISM="Tetraselmis chuii, Strain PLY429" /LENGTH=168 /DNA_ID=CAMNT_0019281951 /DNA_START=520 /DNA_END=1023 /DNA_ORIENTATION=+
MAQGPALSYGIKVYLLLQLILVLMHIPLQQESQPQIVDPTHGEGDFHLALCCTHAEGVAYHDRTLELGTLGIFIVGGTVLGEDHGAQRVGDRCQGGIWELSLNGIDAYPYIIRVGSIVGLGSCKLQPTTPPVVDNSHSPAFASGCVTHPLAVTLCAAASQAVHDEDDW